MRMQTQPVGKSVFGNVACCGGQHGQHAVCIIDNEAPTVELQKKLGRYQSSTLVTVDKRVIARNTVAMRCSQGSSVGIAVRRRACLPVVFRPKRFQTKNVSIIFANCSGWSWCSMWPASSIRATWALGISSKRS